MFENLRQALRDVLSSAPADRREAVSRMRDTLVQARVGLSDLRDGVAETRRRLEAERRELETVTRRKRLASEIADLETVAVAERYERQHAERVAVLERKLAAQEAEVTLAEQELADMTARLKAAGAGIGPTGGASSVSDGGVEGSDLGGLGAGDDALRRDLDRSAREAQADQLLAELKRRMGK
jgi:chromosome segregation ATPase